MGLLVSWAVVGWLGLTLAHADGNVGCLFSPSLCAHEVEWCYNDEAFGRCLQRNVEDEDLYKHKLSPDELQELEREIERLLNLGYRWSHAYTQCLLQAMLYSYKIRTVYEAEVCDGLKDQDLSSALRAFENDEMVIAPQNVAYVKFTPSASNPHADFADEVYIPPVTLDSDFVPKLKNLDLEYTRDGDVPSIREFEPDYVGYFQRQLPVSLVHKKSFPQEHNRHFSIEYNTPDDFRRGFESKDTLSEEPQDEADITNIAEGFMNGEGSQEAYSRDSLLLPVLKAIGDTYPSAREEEGRSRLLEELGQRMVGRESEVERGYAEGGLVLIPDKQTDNDRTLSEFLVGLHSDINWGFKRPERLDVKKPGPPFKTNNYAFKGQSNAELVSNSVGGEYHEKTSNKHRNNKDNVRLNEDLVSQPLELNSIQDELLEVAPPQKKMFSATDLDMAGSHQYDIRDTNFVFVKFKEIISNWSQGARIIKNIEHLLNIPNGSFDEIRVDRDEVTFRVLNNKENLNASAIVHKIEDIKDILKEKMQVTVTSAGIGDKTKLPAVLSLKADTADDIIAVAFVVVVLLVTLVSTAMLLYLMWGYYVSLAKIQSLAMPDTEASKDYQALCRARMAAKPPHDAAAPTAASHRIASLSRESDNSPSSRSSTSSWTEEPALTSMDISTGHMVLSYMEDHLRNKDRLETEWAALCAYESEPCATTIIAQRPENSKKNRYPSALPYDHAHVVLNELSNMSGSDYINASTITDYDPRNPAYIATQGPLPHTAADLWQMVWEQGCVVMVMLTRLIENDVSMCHRYWPEEGSELYHIYEVHLVSEHFWCDDYLVRSFYLKNLKTTETRTVTQFHFMSWPEGGVPVSSKALLEFRRKVNKSFRGRSCPIVVHCSDGVGRTGTYCLLDMVLNRMAKGAKEIDIAATLEYIRDQRGGSVGTKQQFQFVLAAVAEEVQAILRILPQQKADPPPTTQPPVQ